MKTLPGITGWWVVVAGLLAGQLLADDPPAAGRGGAVAGRDGPPREEVAPPDLVTHLEAGPTGGVVSGPSRRGALPMLDGPGGLGFAGPLLGVGEWAGEAQITVFRRDAPLGITIKVDYATGGGTAAPGLDYASTAGTLTFDPFEAFKIITIPLFNDTVFEDVESVFVTLSNPSGAGLGSVGAGLGPVHTLELWIWDDERGVEFASATQWVEEGMGEAQVTLLRGTAPDGPLAVDYATGGGTATAGLDYTPRSGTVVFGPGEPSKTITIPITDDSLFEAEESLLVTLSNPVGWPLGPVNTLKLGIRDNERGIEFWTSRVVVAEGVGEAAVKVFRGTAALGETITVDYAISGGTATAGADYLPRGGTLVFGPGVTNQTILIPLLDDEMREGEEHLWIDLSNPTGSVLGSVGRAEVRISDDDQGIGFRDTVVRVDETVGEAVVTVLRGSSAPTGTFRVGYATGNGRVNPAVAGEDYAPQSGVLVFRPGETAKTIAIPILNDTLTEQEETLLVTLSDPEGTVLGPVPAVDVIIRSDDRGLEFGSTSVFSGEWAGEVQFTILRDVIPMTGTVTVDYATTNGSATAGGDYTARSGTLVFGPGESSKVLAIPLVDDFEVEGSESFGVKLLNPVGASLGPVNSLLVVLNDDDRGFEFSSSTVQVSEGAGEVQVTVLRGSGPAEATLRADYSTGGGNATPGLDYAARSGTLVFAPGETIKTVTIPLLEDVLVEGPESVLLTLSNPVGTRLGSTSVLQLEISDNDRGIEFSEPTRWVGEGIGEIMVTVLLGITPVTGPVAVDYTTGGGTATAGVDYTARSGTLVFAPGESAKTFSIPIFNDALVEGEETLRVTLSNPQGVNLGQNRVLEVRISDDDRGIEFSEPARWVGEGMGEILVTVQRGITPATGTVTVDYATGGGTATPGVDYTARSGTLVFAPGESAKTFSIPVFNDATIEGAETIQVTLSNPQGVNLGQNRILELRISDDDLGIEFENSWYWVSESGGAVRVVVRRGVHPAEGTYTVQYAAGGGTATAAVDYSPVSGTLTFGPGETRKEIVIPVINDSVADPGKTILLTLSNPVGVGLGPQATAEVQIGDNELGYRVDSSPEDPDGLLSVREQAGEVPVTVWRQGDFAIASAVNYRVVAADLGDLGGSVATPGLDFVLAQGTVEFAAGEDRRTLALKLLDDRVPELPEALRIELDQPTGGVPIREGTRLVVIRDNEFNPVRVDPDFVPILPAPPGFWKGSVVRAILPQRDGKQLVQMIASDPWLWSRDRLSRLLANGEPDPTFQPAKVAGGRLLAVDAMGRALVGGEQEFQFNGETVRFLVRLTPEGRVDPSFRPAFPPDFEGGYVRAVAVQPDGMVLVVVWGPTLGTHILLRMAADGALDTRFVDPGVDGPIWGIQFDTGGRILIGGEFSTVGDRPRPGLARLNPNGSLDEGFLADWTRESIRAAVPAPDGRIWVRFADGNEHLVGCLTSGGQVDAGFELRRFPFPPALMVATDHGKVLLGLLYSNGLGQIMRLNPDGKDDPSFVPLQLDVKMEGASVRLLVEPSGNWLILGSYLQSVNGHRRSGMARLLIHAPLPRLEASVGSAEVAEQDGVVPVTLVRVGESALPLEVRWTTAGHTAAIGRDFLATNGVVTFGAGESEQVIRLPLLDNPFPDPDPTLRLQLALPDGTPLPPVEIGIVNDDLGFLPDGIQHPVDDRVRLRFTGHRIQPNPVLQATTDFVNWEEVQWLDPITSEYWVGPASEWDRRFFRLISVP